MRPRFTSDRVGKARAALRLAASRELTHAALSRFPNVHLVLLRDASLPPTVDRRFAFAYAFDVFMHLDLHVQYRYVRDYLALLRKDTLRAG